MAKFYMKSSQRDEEQLVPMKFTIDILLNYSKSLSVIDYNNMKFESLLN